MFIELPIVILIFILSVILIRKNFDLSIKVLIVLSVLLHKEVFSMYKWNFLPVRFFMLGILLVGGSSLVFNLRKCNKDPFVILLGLLWLVRGASIFYSENILASVELYIFFTTVVILGISIYLKYKGQKEKILDFVKFYIWVCLGLGIFGIFQIVIYKTTGFIVGGFWNVPGHLSRVGSTFWDVNHFGALLALLLPVIGVFIFTEKEKFRYIFMFVLLTTMLAVTSSRTSWIIALVAFISFATIVLVRKLGSKGIGILVAISLLIFIPSIIKYNDRSSAFRAYIKDNFHYRLDSFASHIMLLQGSYEIFEEYPILGGGYGGFFEHFKNTDISVTFFGRDPAALNTRVPAHTIWGELVAETGIVGLSVFILFLVVLLSPLFIGAFKKGDLVSSAMFSSLIGIFVAGMFYSYNSEFFWLVIFLYFIYGVSICPEKLNIKINWFPVLLIISAFLIFVGLNSTHLIPWDEAIYAEVAKNMLQSKDYFVMKWEGSNPWFEKPPLGIWLEALSMNFLGFTSLATRLPSAIFGFCTVIITYLFAKRLFSKQVGIISGLVLITTFHFLQYSRYAMLDVTATFFMICGLFLYWVAKSDRGFSYWIFSGVVMGLGVLTKGVVGFLPLIVICLYELYLIFIEKQKFELKNYIAICVSFVVVCLPWHLAMYLRFGKDFVNSYLIYHIFDRAISAIEDKGQPFYWYLIVLKVSMRLWFIVLLSAFPFSVIRGLKYKDKKHLFLVFWSLVILIFFSVAKSKIIWYIIPVYPVLAIINGYFIVWLIKKIPKYQDLAIYLVFVVGVGYLFVNKNMIYTPDLTGSKARLLELRDKEFPTNDILYVHAVELPLILYYTERPFSGYNIDFNKGKIPFQEYSNRLLLLAKKGRFPENEFNLNGKETRVVGEDGDYILWYYKSDEELEEALLKKR